MSLILSGTDGLSDVDGSASTPAIRGTDANTGMFFPAADTIAFAEGGVESMRIDSLGQLGIGTSSPGYRLDVAAGDTTAGLGYAARLRSNSTAGAATLQFTNNAVTNQNAYITADDSQNLTLASGTGYARLWTNGSERMRIDSSGNVGIGTSSPTFKLTVVDNSTGQQASINSSSSNGTSVGFTSTSTNGRTWRVGTNYVTGSGEFSIYDSTAAAERLVINSSGNVGIGTSSPSKLFEVRGADSVARFRGSSTQYLDITATNGGTVNLDANNGTAFAFSVNNTERMRIDNSGNLLVGTTSTIGASQEILNVRNINAGAWGIAVGNSAGSSTSGCIGFYNSNGRVGSITTSGSATTYSTSSDYRLKEDITPMTGALDKVSALKPVTYKWKIDGSDGQGFIAHELAEVVPDCVTGEKDAVDAEGKPVYQGIDTSFLVATLTAAIQEQQAMIEELKAEVAALKAA